MKNHAYSVRLFTLIGIGLASAAASQLLLAVILTGKFPVLLMVVTQILALLIAFVIGAAVGTVDERKSAARRREFERAMWDDPAHNSDSWKAN